MATWETMFMYELCSHIDTSTDTDCRAAQQVLVSSTVVELYALQNLWYEALC